MNPRPATFDPTVRRSIEDEIERLISLLDFLSPDPDLEDCADGEPWLSWPEEGPGPQASTIRIAPSSTATNVT